MSLRNAVEPIKVHQDPSNYSAKYVWTLTTEHNMALSDVGLVIEFLERYCKHWCIGIYMRKSCGRRIMVCNISLRNKMREGTLSGYFSECILTGAIILPCVWGAADKHFFAAFTHYLEEELELTDGLYSSVQNTRLAMPWQVRRIAEAATWYPWQKQLMNNCATGREDREVNILVDTEGSQGKTMVTMYLACIGIAARIPLLRDATALSQSVMNRPTMKAYFFDIPRDVKSYQASNIFAFIEELKNGHVCDPRYHYRERYMDSPVVWVLTNWWPDPKMLTKNRWRYWAIVDVHVEGEIHKVLVPHNEAQVPMWSYNQMVDKINEMELVEAVNWARIANPQQQAAGGNQPPGPPLDQASDALPTKTALTSTSPPKKRTRRIRGG